MAMKRPRTSRRLPAAMTDDQIKTVWEKLDHAGLLSGAWSGLKPGVPIEDDGVPDGVWSEFVNILKAAANNEPAGR